MNLRNMSIRSRLSLAFGGLAVLVLLVSALALMALADANARFTSYTSGLNARATLAAHVRAAVDDRAIAARNLVLVSKDSDVAREKAAVQQAHQDVQDSMTRLNTMIANSTDVSPQARALVGDMNRIESDYGKVALGIVGLALEGKRDQAITRMNDECRPLLAALIKATSEYAAFTEASTQALQQSALADYEFQRNAMVALCLVAVLAAGLAGWLITRSIARPLNRAVEAADRIALGDLSSEIHVTSTDETGRLLDSLQRMQQSLVDTVGSVRSNAESVSLASAQIAQGNNDLSMRTEQQASALQETAASMEQLGATVRTNAENAQQAGQLAVAASGIATKGGNVVGQVVKTMKDINDSSRQIAEIISVIDGIAFQTNILALNAAVEAARAGDQGRGFSVVAAEVRNLAQRSAQAAKEIKTLITTSVERVEQGTTLVDQAGSTMQEIVTSVQRVSDIMAEISAASSEQSQGVAQVGEAVTQMDQATQQNAALVEESAAAASSLSDQAAQLVQAVAVFRINAEAQIAQAVQTKPLAVRTEASSSDYTGPERRGPHRASNVTRLQPGNQRQAHATVTAVANNAQRTGTHDWENF